MILPTKHTSSRTSLIGIGAQILPMLERPVSFSELWHTVKLQRFVLSYDQVLNALTFLYVVGAIDFCDGLIQRRAGNAHTKS